MPNVDLLEGLKLGTSRAHSGRVNHVVAIETYQKRVGGTFEVPVEETRVRVVRALCGYVPVEWYPPCEGVGHGIGHQRCRELLALRRETMAD